MQLFLALYGGNGSSEETGGIMSFGPSWSFVMKFAPQNNTRKCVPKNSCNMKYKNSSYNHTICTVFYLEKLSGNDTKRNAKNEEKNDAKIRKN